MGSWNYYIIIFDTDNTSTRLLSFYRGFFGSKQIINLNGFLNVNGFKEVDKCNTNK